MKGIDTSHHQGDKKLIDWVKVKQAGFEFAFLKCSQGTTFIDKMFQRDKIEARKAGLLCGFYHFAGNYNGRISLPQLPKDEADWFIKNVGDIQEGESLILDWEVNHANPADWCKEFMERVEEKTKVKPWFYSYQAKVLATNWDKIKTYPLWEARYSKPDIGQMGTAPLVRAWDKWLIWQNSSKGNVKGISGNVDLNYTNLSREDLSKLGKISTEPVEEDYNAKCLIYPIDEIYITQGFGENPVMYKKFELAGHNGIDFRTKFWDSPLGHRYVVAAKDGKVIELGNEGKTGYGIFIRLEHDLDGNGNEQTVYGHLKKWYINKGDYVKQGQRIGLTDNTGYSTGSHLHWGYRPKGWKKIYSNGFKGYVNQLNLIV